MNSRKKVFSVKSLYSVLELAKVSTLDQLQERGWSFMNVSFARRKSNQ